MKRRAAWLAREPAWPEEAWQHVERKLPRQARALRLYWTTDMTLADVARELGVTQERIRQMTLRAWREGRHISRMWTPERQWREFRDEMRDA